MSNYEAFTYQVKDRWVIGVQHTASGNARLFGQASTQKHAIRRANVIIKRLEAQK